MVAVLKPIWTTKRETARRVGGSGAAARGSQAEARLADEVARYEDRRPVGAGLPDWMYPTMDTLQWVISGLFLLEYACRIWAAERRLQYLSRSPEQ